MAAPSNISRFLEAVATGDGATVDNLLATDPALATAALARSDERFVDACLAQLYEGDTALHAAAYAYDVARARELVARGAHVQARNRRGAQPLHAAANGTPGSAHWAPERQRAVIGYLISAGADPDAAAAGGVTPLHRAVRNRCPAAVDGLLAAGADPFRPNSRGSTAFDLARWTTGRSSSGSPEAHAEQQAVTALLEQHRNRPARTHPGRD